MDKEIKLLRQSLTKSITTLSFINLFTNISRTYTIQALLV